MAKMLSRVTKLFKSADKTSEESEEPLPTPDSPEMCLMLLGKTGHGKSASGNSIIGRKHFKSSGSSQSVTRVADMTTANIEGRLLKVVDTPGLGDTKLDTEAGMKLALEGFNSGVAFCPEGFQALVLVFKHNQRMTREETDAIQALKSMLGNDVIRLYTVLLITHGDSFDPSEDGEEDMTFKDWCKQQEGSMKDLLEECDYRCILFNNRSKDANELSLQRQELVDCVDSLQSQGRRYTNRLFDQAKEIWEKDKKRQKSIEINEEINRVFNEISGSLLTARENSTEMDDAYFKKLIEKLDTLKSKIADLEEPEKGEKEEQIQQMSSRIQYYQKNKGNEKMLQETLQQMREEQKQLEEKHRMDLQDVQKKFLEQQNENMKEIMKNIKPNVVVCAIA